MCASHWGHRSSAYKTGHVNQVRTAFSNQLPPWHGLVLQSKRISLACYTYLEIFFWSTGCRHTSANAGIQPSTYSRHCQVISLIYSSISVLYEYVASCLCQKMMEFCVHIFFSIFLCCCHSGIKLIILALPSRSYILPILLVHVFVIAHNQFLWRMNQNVLR